MKSLLIPSAAAVWLCTLSSAPAMIHAVENSLFDPDDATLLNGGADTVLGSGHSVSINTDTLSFSVSGPGGFSATGNLGLTQGLSAAGSQEVALFSFSNLTINDGTSFTSTGSRPLYLLSQGNLTFNANWTVGAGGYSSNWGNTGSPGNGPGAGGSSYVSGTWYGGGAGHASVGSDGSVPGLGGAAYGDAQISDIQGGSSGGNGQPSNPFGTSPGNGSGGSGGGAIGLISQETLTLGPDARIAARGLGGTNDNGGDGSGGTILLASPTISLEDGHYLSVSPGTAFGGGPPGSYGRLAYYYHGDSLEGTLRFNGDNGPGSGVPHTNYTGSLFLNDGLNYPQELNAAIPEVSSWMAGTVGLLLLIGHRRRAA